jgi:DNA-binding beta-propeller fold protein YncE
MARWGQAGKGAGLFDTISDLAVSPDGMIAVLDAGNNDVQMFTAAGNEALYLGGDQLGIAHASGIAWGRDGKIYIADTATNRVLRVDRSGLVEATLGSGDGKHRAIEQPTDVAVTADGIVYAVDLRGRVVRFDTAGIIDQEFQVPAGSVRGGSHLEIWDDVLAVTDPDHSDINFVDRATGLLLTARTPDNSSLGLNVPVGVAVGQDGLLYVLDSDNNRVVVLEKVK